MVTNNSTTNIPPFVPNHYWFNLKECCALKGLCYKTACNKKWLQPNSGEPEGTVGGRKVWSYNTVADWITKSDSEL